MTSTSIDVVVVVGGLRGRRDLQSARRPQQRHCGRRVVNYFDLVLNPSIIGAYASVGDPLGCIAQAQAMVAAFRVNASCDPATFAGCVPFGDMDANYSNGSSIYHGLSVNLRKRFQQPLRISPPLPASSSHSIDARAR